MEYKYAVLIGRFQPIHNGHVDLIKHGLSIAENVIVILGSINSARTIKNPFTFEERKRLLLDSVAPNNELSIEGEAIPSFKYNSLRDRISICGVRDFHYNENSWIADIQAQTDQFIQEGDAVAILGEYKDSSSYYLKYFPQWDFIPVKNPQKLDATEVRQYLFGSVDSTVDWEGKISNPPNLEPLKEKVSSEVLYFLNKFIKTEDYASLVAEYNYIAEYKKKWSGAPFPPTFTTADCVVVCSGHVLVVKRKFNPGKGLYALPGGFIKQDERIRNAALRELKEETGIRVDKVILDSSIVDEKVFDYPARSLRGRTITHAYYVQLKDGRLPEVRGNDDAEKAIWLPIADVMRNEHLFFEDHSSIVMYFVSRGLK